MYWHEVQLISLKIKLIASTDIVSLISLALAEIYLVIATVFRRFNIELHDTTRERDIDVSRDCFIAEVSPESRGIWVKATASCKV